MTDSQDNSLAIALLGDVRKNWGWIMAGGALLVILGAIGLSMGFAMTIATVIYFGVLVLIGGVFMLVDTFKAEGWKSKLWHLLIGLCYLCAGIVMVIYPAGSAVWFTLFIAAFLIIVGSLRIVGGLQIRGVAGWGWTAAAGVASVVLGFMIFAEWPISGLWAIGLFVSIDLLMQGVSLIMISWAARSAGAEAQAAI